MLFKNKKKSTGVFIPTTGVQYEQFKGDVGKKSVNSIAVGLGYDPAQIHFVHTFDKYKGIDGIAVLPFTREPIFVLTDESTLAVSTNMANQILKAVDWEMEYDSNEVETILGEAIESKSWDIEYMRRIFKTIGDKGDQHFESEDFGLYLIIWDGLLAGYNTADGLSTWGKWLKSVNPDMLQGYQEDGVRLHGRNAKAIDYVNLQADSLANLTGGITNPHVKNYTLPNGSIDFFMILVEKEKQPVSIEAFELRMGNTAQLVSDEASIVTYQVNGNSYHFRERKLHSIERRTADII